MIDGSNDPADLSQEEWNELTGRTLAGVDTNLSEFRSHDSTFDAIGLAGGGSNVHPTGVNTGVSPEVLSVRGGVSLGPSGHFSSLSGGSGVGS